MWYLTSNTDHRVIYVLSNKEITIGRSVDAQVCNFAIPDDPSISRKHATLVVLEDNLYVEDMGSRYGTFINDFSTKVEPNAKIPLNDAYSIRFGKMNSVWNVHKIRFITCTSTLKGEQLQSLKLSLSKLGGQLRNEWDENCAYLTMPAITLTIKVVLALAHGSHIVTTDFWTKCIDAVNHNTLLPNPSNYTPQVVESTLNKENVSFLPNDARKTLLKGKTVVFFSRKQFEMYKSVLSASCATPLLFSETQLTKISLCEPNVFVIQYNTATASQETQAQKNQINEIINYMKSKGKRAIADAEIGLAVLYCSTEKYCNPDFNFSSEVIKQTTEGNGSPANVLAQESQEQTQKLNYKNENVVINETLSGSKRKNEDDDLVMNSNKKFATGSVKSTTHNDSTKRKLAEDESNTNPSKRLAVGDEDEDAFKFPGTTVKQEISEKKLNFTKPKQRKQDMATNDDEEMFNFEDGKKPAKESSKGLFESNDDDIIEIIPKKMQLTDEKIDFTALRGSKLKELMENNSKLEFHIKTIKKEEPEESELDVKMGELDLGEVVLVRKPLVVKKEPMQIGVSFAEQRNFKKFKKVWPINMQVSRVPRTSMNSVLVAATPDVAESLSY